MADSSNMPRNEGLPISETALAQLYRGELGRSDRWRLRLDTTSNWALTTTAAVVSYAFSNAQTSHIVLLVGLWMVLSFLIVEARRYQYYDLWIHRVRLLEDGYWAPMLRHEPVDPDALKELALELSRPQIQLSLASALATRLHRVYWALLIVLLSAWFVKLFSHPTPVGHPHEIIHRAHVGFIPGYLVMTGLVLISITTLILISLSFLTRPPLGELRHRQRPRKVPLWEAFARPYAVKSPRRAHPHGREQPPVQH